MEVVGVVLGALPLAIEAVKSYQECLGAVRSYWRYNDTLEGIKNNLFLQQQILQTTWEDFTGLNDPTPDQIKQELARLSAHQYHGFVKLIEHLNLLFSQILEKLDVDCKGKPRWRCENPERRAKWEWKRVKNSFGRRATKELFDEINLWNHALRLSLMPKREVPSDQSDPLVKSQSTKYDESGCNAIRRKATILHHVLDASWCRSHDAHIGGINVAWHQEQQDESTPEQYMLLSLPQPDGENTKLQYWDGINVSFHSKDQTHQAISSGQNEQVLPPPASNSYLDDMQPIISLCDRDFRARASWDGYLQHTNHMGRTIVALKRRASGGESPTAGKSLCSLLSSNNLLFRPRDQAQSLMTRRDRYCLAAAASRTVLLLCGTSWLQQQWLNKDDLWILHEQRSILDTGKHKESEGLLTLIHNFSGKTKCATKDHEHQTTYVKHETIFSLGILLIELALNRPFDRIRNEYYETLGISKSSTVVDDFKIADLTLASVRSEVGDSYADAIERCLSCHFLCPGGIRDFENPKFRELFYSGVVVPIQATFKSMS